MLTTLFFLAWSIKPQSESIPYRQPQLAAGQGQVAMAFGAGSSIYFAASPDQGATFSKPVRVAETGALALGRHRGPRLAILKNALLISAIAGEKVATGAHAHGLPEAGDLLVWRSTDKGATWTRAATINDVPGAAREGLHAMVASGDGKVVHAAWLDLRAKGTQLYESHSSDGGLSWSKNSLAYESPDGSICQCCHPSLAIDAKGRGVWAMWRNAIDGSRDMYAARAADGAHFGEARKLGQGTWKLNACPMDGGGFVVAKGRVSSAWRRDGDIILDEAGGPERVLGTGKDPAIASGRAGIYAAWTKDGAVRVREPGSDASRVIGPDGGFANLLALDDGGVLAAWESRGSIETQRLK